MGFIACQVKADECIFECQQAVEFLPGDFGTVIGG